LIYGLLEQYGRYGAAIVHYTELTAFFDQAEKEMEDNRDFGVIPCFDTVEEQRKLDEMRRQTFCEQPQMLQSPPPLYLSEYVNTPKIDLLMRLIRSGVSLVDYVKELISNSVTAQIDEDKLLHCLPTASAFNSTTGPLSVHLSLRHYSMVLQTIALARLAIRSLEIVLDSVSGFSSVNQRNKKISTAKWIFEIIKS
uniref:CCR4-NOT transcription complex subunit 11 n=1 Tax=Gongylonema pulchrum TaxID=637853 RepID=A0A183EHV9_9BILA